LTRPDFIEMARAWLVRATGHARESTEQSLAAEIERVWELGIANAIEAVHDFDADGPIPIRIEEKLRALLEKPTDPRGN
jgi:hypothetical protein